MEYGLVITEKPSVARDLAAALGGFTEGEEHLERGDIAITWAVGHLLELCEPQDYDANWRSWALKLLPIVPERFDVKPREGQKKRLDAIGKLGKKATYLVNACDAGREGELIYRRIVGYAGLGDRPQRRLWLQSMTAESIREAFGSMSDGHDYDQLGDAAWLRSVGDWLVGMNATRGLTARLKARNERASWSAGRVQTPTLAMLVGREREILAHVPRSYRVLRATFEGGVGPHTWEGRYVDVQAPPSQDRDVRSDRIFDLERAAALTDAVTSAGAGVASEKRKRSRSNPPLPYDLTTLQRDANKRHGLSARRTSDAAQRLYEIHKLVTYPRTDSRHLPSDYTATVSQIVESLVDLPGLGDVAQTVIRAGVQNLDVVLDDTKVSDHFAIVPTGKLPAEPLTGDDLRVYERIVRQFLAALMGPATHATVEREVVIDAGPLGSATFRATSRTLEIPGFLEALGQEAEDEARLPPLVAGDDAPTGVNVALVSAVADDKETTPPPRYTEAQLLRMMETAGESEADVGEAVIAYGLGTPATRADIIERLVGGEDSYARRVEGKLMPTHKGMRLVDFLERAAVPGLASPRMTGEWEYALRQVERGDKVRDEVLDGLVATTRAVVDRLQNVELSALYASEPSVGPCPVCGSDVLENPWGYPCRNNAGAGSGCPFMLWKDRFGRYIDRGLAGRLLRDRRVEGVSGFVDRSGRAMPPATLTLRKDPATERWNPEPSFGEGDANAGEEVVVGPVAPCPAHPDCELIETSHRYVCAQVLAGTVRVGPSLPRVVCQREVSGDEARAWAGPDGRTALLEAFVSKRGRPFKGMLVRRENGRYGFEFPERPGGERPRRGAPKAKAAANDDAGVKATKKGKAPATKAAAPKKAAAKTTAAKTTPAKKTPAKKAAAKKATAKKATPKTSTSKKTTAVEAAGQKAEKSAAKNAAPKKAAKKKSLPKKAKGKKAAPKKAPATVEV